MSSVVECRVQASGDQAVKVEKGKAAVREQAWVGVENSRRVGVVSRPPRTKNRRAVGNEWKRVPERSDGWPGGWKQ